MDKINHPHDKLFKETFGDLDVTTNFMNHYLPKEILDIIDIDTLSSQNGSFIESELKDSYSDLLFHVRIGEEVGYLYFLFEHKSYPAKDIAFQLLGYMLQIWGNHIKKRRPKHYRLSSPFFFTTVNKNGKRLKR